MIFMQIHSEQCASWSRAQSGASFSTLQIVRQLFECPYSPNLYRGLCQLWVLIGLLPKAINRKGKAPWRLQASIFSAFWIASLPNAIVKRGGPQALIFTDPSIASLSSERGGPPVGFEHRYSPTLWKLHEREGSNWASIIETSIASLLNEKGGPLSALSITIW